MNTILPEWTKYDNLYKALKKSCKNVRWKTSVTQFEINALSNVSKLLEELKTNNYQLKPYTEFDVYEPKRRHIKATRIRDRVIQRSFCDNYFYPLITQSFIYDNCACQIGKGPDFATKRLKQHYRRFYHKYRNNYGWVLKCDIHHFFESIDHNILKQLLIKKNMDDFSLNFIFQIIDSFGEVGLGLGSQVSQLLALFYLNELDHIIKEKFHIKAYIRYMDDFIIIHKDKEKLLEILNFLKEYLPSIGLELNNKTILQPIGKKVSFLKWKFTLTDSGKVLMLVDSKEMTKKRRKVKAIINKYKNGQITKDQLDQSINGIMNHLSKGMTFKARKNLNNFIRQNLNDKGERYIIMSVRKSDRDKNILQAEIEAKNLAVYTLQMCQNNEIFPKSVRWVLCDRIINACTDLFISVRKANAIKVTLLEDAVLRENYQRAALGKLITLQSLMTLAVDCYNIKASKFETWSKFYNTTIKYIRAWHNSDKKKHDAMFDRKSIDLIANQKPNLPTEKDGVADIADRELLILDTAKTVDELQNFSKSKKLF